MRQEGNNSLSLEESFKDLNKVDDDESLSDAQIDQQ